MKKIIYLILLSEIAFGQTPSNDPHWQLLWEDYFNSFDNSKWIKADYCDHGGEPTLQLAQNAYVSGGNLVIKVDHNPTYCPSNPPPVTSWACGSCNVGTHPYTSGWVENASSFNVQYGYVEARVKVPFGKGLWPAFWTFVGDGVSGTNAAEIDILEILGDLSSFSNLNNLPADQVSTTNIHRNYCPPLCPQPNYFSALMVSSYTDWHKYAIEWSPSKLIWYIDDNPVRLISNHGITDPVRLIFAVGVQMDNNRNPISSLSSTSFPQYMYVDYIKVYELNSDCNDFINTTNYDFSTYNNVEKNFIRIGQGGGNNSLSNGQEITLRASQFIELSGDFNVPVGTSIYLDANKDCSTDLGLKCTQTFNPCVYDFSIYDNSVKRIIDLGGNGCTFTITPTTNNISLEAKEEIHLKPGVNITTVPGESVELKIVPCN